MILYCYVGQRVRQEILNEQRADYGAEIVATLSRQLTLRYFIALIPFDKLFQREFYSEMCRIEGWLHPGLPRAPGHCSEKVLESTIRDMESFLLELGGGFCFMARQQRMQIDDRDYYLDLRFYHRKLHRLIAVDLKLGQFDAADKGQIELYPGWLKKHRKEPDEADPLGMILCAGKSEEHIAFLELEKSGIHVASYWTDLPPKEQLERNLHEAVHLARARLEADSARSRRS